MATTRLGRYQVERDELPNLCMRCGEPATIQKARTFAWTPPWVIVTILAGLLPYLIIAMVLTKRMRVMVPLCDVHRNHWLTRGLIILVTFLLLLVLVGLTIAFSDRDFVGIFVVALLVGIVAWLVVIAIAQNTAIRAGEITDRSITLKNVGQTFADAVVEERDRRRLEDEAYFGDRPRARREDDWYSDRPSSRGRRPREDDDRYYNRDEPRRPRRERSREDEDY